ncbi:hypothetical protein SAMN02745116_00534 [Pilibacter termitis]|jgi:hypothetical protein|uniref:Uncharacterized protein n=1 Tax=Pilibacter termitis TaxID=263852 RepID=A0A1T4L4P1_9ENTE|nr:hypothetical protein [Pilibacter termitis]SJZ49511.1 hypothetical protein SAMN02745116_00534 [Pilibacter termitis]
MNDKRVEQVAREFLSDFEREFQRIEQAETTRELFHLLNRLTSKEFSKGVLVLYGLQVGLVIGKRAERTKKRAFKEQP